MGVVTFGDRESPGDLIVRDVETWSAKGSFLKSDAGFNIQPPTFQVLMCQIERPATFRGPPLPSLATHSRLRSQHLGLLQYDQGPTAGWPPALPEQSLVLACYMAKRRQDQCGSLNKVDQE